MPETLFHALFKPFKIDDPVFHSPRLRDKARPTSSCISSILLKKSLAAGVALSLMALSN